MKYSLKSLMLAAFSFRDLLWLAVVLLLLWWWGTDRWVSEYTHQMFMRMKDGEIKELKEKLKTQAPTPSPPNP
jgi:hypothetical protein